jgi:hypothetical protein
MRFALVLLATLAASFAASACAKKNTDPNGVGPWQFGKSKLADAKAAGRCLPVEGGVVQCIGLSAMQVGGQTAGTELYFSSPADESALIEISLTVKACDARSVANDLAARIGAPKAELDGGTRVIWKLSTMVVRALVPEKRSGECQVNFVLPTDTQRIADFEASQP